MINNINYVWRIAATGLCFVVFSSGGFLFSITVFPLIRLLPIGKIRKKEVTRLFIHHSFRLFVWLMSAVGVLRVSVVNPEKLDNAGNHLIIANHPCLIDVVLIISLVKKAGCIVKAALWKSPFLGRVVSSAGYIKNSEPQALVDLCLKYLESRSPLIIFPEGTRTVPGKAIKFHRGAAHVALRSRKNIIPIIINCTPPSLAKNEKWYNIPRTGRVHITLRVGDTINLSPFTGDNSPLAARKLTRFLENYFQQETVKNERLDTRAQRIDYPVPGPGRYSA